MARNIRLHTPRCVKKLRIVVAAGTTGVGRNRTISDGATFSGLFCTFRPGKSMPSYNDAAPPRTQFSILYRSLLQSDELPLRLLVSDRRIAEIFAEEGISFGRTMTRSTRPP